MPIPVTVICLPVGTMPRNSPWWVPLALQRVTTLSLSYLILNNGTKVWEGLVKLAGKPFDVLGTAFLGVPVGLVGDVPVENIVHQVQIPLVAHLFDVAPKHCLILFFRHALFSFLPLLWRAALVGSVRPELGFLHALGGCRISTPQLFCSMVASCWLGLLVPGLDVHLPDDLTVSYIERRRS
jgi:hypothetical protein